MAYHKNPDACKYGWPNKSLDILFVYIIHNVNKFASERLQNAVWGSDASWLIKGVTGDRNVQVRHLEISHFTCATIKCSPVK